MFMIKSLFGKMWGDPQNPEIVQLKAGMLFLVRPDSIKGSRECIFKDAVATVRRTTAEHQYQLVITRAYEEGEAELLDGDAETEDERSFLIDASLNFRPSSFEGDPSFAWKDIDYDDEEEESDADEGELFEFVVDSKAVDKATLTVFELTMLHCMFERKFNRSHDEATDAELEDLKYKPPRHPLKSLSQSHSPDTPSKPTRVNSDGLADSFNALSVSSASTPTSKPAAFSSSSKGKSPVKTPVAKQEPSSPAAVLAPVELAPPIEEQVVAIIADERDEEELVVVDEAKAEIYLFDVEVEHFVLQGEVKITLIEKDAKTFDYWLACNLVDPFKWIISQPINAEMNARWSQEALAFMWNFIPLDETDSPKTWSLRFTSVAEYLEFNHSFNRCLWQKANQQSWGKAKPADHAYVYSAYEDSEMVGIEEEEEDEEEEEEEEVKREQSEEEETGSDHGSDTESDSDDGQPRVAADGHKNEHLAVGYKHERSFVVRGNNVGVFRHTDDDKLKHSTTISNIKNKKGQSFAPSKVMLHNEDSSMLLMSQLDPHSVFRMDLETGKVVDEWKVSDVVEVDNIVANNKFAQMTAEQTVIGHSHNGIFRIDPRLAGNKMVESQFKQYVSKNDFSAAATTESGKLAVASNKGDIRLFDSLGKNAKTALPALGDAIIGIDVTADGRWIIATCKTYLLLIDTLIGDGKNKGSYGFDKPFPADSKPIPRRLQLKPEHVQYMNQAGNPPLSFTAARFNSGLGEEEKSIVTSTGKFVITWNFRRVKQGRMDDYKISSYNDTVVADNFKLGTNGSGIVVALPNDV
ncbi:VID27 cytoplasmic protein-domain-containing protein [Mrakia frigida]|uniref:Vid27p n=1 Tax=Mrakia frigida TaxID=29902 RepID=UPI003FCC202C